LGNDRSSLLTTLVVERKNENCFFSVAYGELPLGIQMHNCIRNEVIFGKGAKWATPVVGYGMFIPEGQSIGRRKCTEFMGAIPLKGHPPWMNIACSIRRKVGRAGWRKSKDRFKAKQRLILSAA
jgi:hypothetical protein